MDYCSRFLAQGLHRGLLFAALLSAALSASPAYAQGSTDEQFEEQPDIVDLPTSVDARWTLTAAGKVVVPLSNGAWRVTNISAPDLFGEGGPGTAPDFLSDDFIRITGVAAISGQTFYCFSEPFQINGGSPGNRGNVTFVVSGLTFTREPPPLPASIEITSSSSVLQASQKLQLTVTGTMGDGSTQDMTFRSSWTVYRTSNPGIATVGKDGNVLGVSPGIVFLTAINDGATAVKRLIVTAQKLTTTVTGIVQIDPGAGFQPIEGATVTTSFGNTTTTAADGSFSMEVDVPEGFGTVSVTATGEFGTETVSGAVVNIPIVVGGFTDAGFINVAELVTWTGTAGNQLWDDGDNWSTGVVPGLGDTVLIDVENSDIIVTLSNGSFACDSLISNERLHLTNCTFEVGSSIQVNNTFQLNNGAVLKNATVIPGDSGEGILVNSATNSPAVLDGCVVETCIDFPVIQSRKLRVINGLTMNGEVVWQATTGFYHRVIEFDGTQTCTGVGTFRFRATSFNNNDTIASVNGTLTLDEGISVVGGRGNITGTVLNKGSIRAETNGRKIVINGTGWENRGEILATNGGQLELNGAGWLNNGLVDVDGGALTLLGSFTNNGDVNADNSAVSLGGTITGAQLSSLNLTNNSSLRFANGTLNIEGETFTIDSTVNFANLTVDGGVAGGTLNVVDPCSLIITGATTFVNLTVSGEVTVRSVLNIKDDFTLNGTILFDAGWSGRVDFNDNVDQTFLGAATVQFPSNSGNPSFRKIGSGRLISEAGAVFRGGRGSLAGPITYRGPVYPTVAGQTLTVQGTDWINESEMRNAGGGHPGGGNGNLTCRGTWTNDGTIHVEGGAALEISGSPDITTNAGSVVECVASHLRLGVAGGPNTYKEVQAAITRTNLTELTLLAGTFDNTGETFTCQQKTSLGGVNFVGGTIDVNGQDFGLSTTTSTVRGVTIEGDIQMRTFQLNVYDGLTLNGAARFAVGSSWMRFWGAAQTLGGNAEILFTTFGYPRLYNSGSAVTIASTVTIRARQGNLYGGAGFTYEGTVVANFAGARLDVNGIWTNSGTFRNENGGFMSLSGTWTNDGTMTFGGGGNLTMDGIWTNNATRSISLDGGGTLTARGTYANNGSITVTDSAFGIGGTVDTSKLASFTLVNPTSFIFVSGVFDLAGGSYTFVEDSTIEGMDFRNGTLDIPATVDVEVKSASTFRGITITGDLTMRSTLYVWDSLTLDGKLSLTDFAFLYFRNGGWTLDGTGEIEFTGTGTPTIYSSSGSHITIADTIEIFGTRGNINGRFTFEGDIRSVGTGDQIHLLGLWTLKGSLTNESGGWVRLSGTWTLDSTGVVDIDGGQLWVEGTRTFVAGSSAEIANGKLIMGGTFDFDALSDVTRTNLTAFELSNANLDLLTNTLVLDEPTRFISSTVKNGTVEVGIGGTLTLVNSCFFDGLALDGDATNDGTLYLRNGFTLTGTITVSGYSDRIYFDTGAMTVDGTGEFLFSNNSFQQFRNFHAGTVTLETGITIRGGSLDIFGNFLFKGTISAETSGRRISIQSGTWENEGTIKAENGADLLLQGTWTNSSTGPGLVKISGGGRLTLGGTMTNDGDVEVLESHVVVGGTLDAATIAGFTLTDILSITYGSGTFDNTASTLTIDAPTVFSGITIEGGTIEVVSGGSLRIDGASTLRDVIFDGDLTVRSQLFIGGSLELNGSCIGEQGRFSTVEFVAGGPAVTGTGDFVCPGSGQLTLRHFDAVNAVSLGADIEVRGGNGILQGGYTIEGSVTCDKAGRTITISGGAWTNNGDIANANGGSIGVLGFAWTNNGTVSVTGGGKLTVGAPFTNNGTLEVDSAELELQGQYGSATSALISQTNVTKLVFGAGTYDNESDTLTLTRDLVLRGVEIRKGIISVPSTSTLTVESTSTFTDVTLNGEVDIRARLNIQNGWTLNDTANMFGYSSQIRFQGGAQTWDGTGEAFFASSFGGTIYNLSGNLVTIADTLTIRGGGGTIDGLFDIQCDVIAGSPGQTITIRGNGWVNNGTTSLRGENGGRLSLSGTWTNNGSIDVSGNGRLTLRGVWSSPGDITVNGSFLDIGGNFGPTDYANITQTNLTGLVFGSGTFENSGNTFTISQATTFSYGFNITGGTLAVLPGVVLTVQSSTFTGVTVDGDFRLQSRLYVRDDLAMDGTLTLLSGADIYFQQSSQSVSGNCEINATGSGHLIRTDNGFRTTFESTTTVRGGDLQFGSTPTYYGAFDLLGTVTSDRPNRRITIQSPGWTNAGTINNANGGFVQLDGSSWSNSGTIAVTGGGELAIAGSFTDTGTISVEDSAFVAGGDINSVLDAITQTNVTTLGFRNGTYTNTGETYLLQADMIWDRVVFDGGTLQIPSTVALTLTGYNCAFQGNVDVVGDITVNSARLEIRDNTSVDGTVFMGSDSQARMEFPNSGTTFSGPCVIDFHDTQYNQVSSFAGTTTFASDVDFVGGNAFFYGSFVIDGDVLANASGQTIAFRSGTYTFNGSLDAASGAFLDISTNMATINGAVSVIGGGRLTLGGTYAVGGSGSISVTESSLWIGGVVTQAAIDAIVLTNPTDFRFTNGTFDITGTTFTVDFPLTIAGFTITGGTLDVVAGGSITTESGARFYGVTVDGDITHSQGYFYIRNGITMNGDLIFANTSSFQYIWFLNDGFPQTFGGTGSVRFDNDGANYFYNTSGQVVTVGPDMELIGGTALCYGTNVYEGEVRAESASLQVQIDGSGWTNEGLFENANGGSLYLRGTDWTNAVGATVSVTGGGQLRIDGTRTNNGTIEAVDSIFQIGGNYGAADFADFTLTSLTKLILNGTFDNSGGSYTFGSDTDLSSVDLVGGALTAATGKTVKAIGNVDFMGVDSWAGELEINGSVNVYDGITLSGTWTMGTGTSGSAYINFQGGSQTLAGTGEIVFNATGFNRLYDFTSGNSTTIGADITIRGGRGNVEGPFSLEGEIVSEVAGQTIAVTGTDWINKGTIRNANAGNISVTGTNWTNDTGALISVADGGMLTVGGTFTNLGTIEVDNAALAVSGVNIADVLAEVDQTAVTGLTFQGGTYDNTASSLSVAAGTTMTFNGLTFLGGSIDVDITGALNFVGGASTLDGVTINGDFASSSTIFVANDLTLNGTATFTSGGFTFTGDSQTFDGNAVVDVAGFGTFRDNTAGNTATIASTVGISLTSTGFGMSFQGDFLLQGEIVCGNPNVNCTLVGDWTNEGTIRGENGGNISCDGEAWTNAATGVIETLGGGRLSILGGHTLDGTQTCNASHLTVGGDSILGDLPSITRIALLSLTFGPGEIDNTAGTYTLADDLNLGGVTFVGGTISVPGAFTLTNTANSILDGVTLNGDICLQSSMRIRNGLTLNGDMTLKGTDTTVSQFFYTNLTWLGTQTLDGAGQVIFDAEEGSGSTAQFSIPTGTTLTVDPGVTIRGGAGLISGGGTFICDGNIMADVAGKTLSIQCANFENTGIAEAIAGGGLQIRAYNSNTNNGTWRATGGSELGLRAPWTNNGTITVTDSGLGFISDLDDALGSLSDISITNLLGLRLQDGELAADATVGVFTVDRPLTFDGVRFIGTDIDIVPGGSLVLEGSTNRFENHVTVDGDFDLNNKLRIDEDEGLTCNGTITMGPGSQLRFSSDHGALFDGTCTVQWPSGPGSASIRTGGDHGPLSIEDTVTINGGSGTLKGDVVLKGTVSCDGAGNVATLDGSFLIDTTGSVDATNGCDLSLIGYGWTNDGTVTISGGGVMVVHTNTWTNLGTITITDSELRVGGSFVASDLDNIDQTNVTAFGFENGTFDLEGGTWTADGDTTCIGMVFEDGTLDMNGFKMTVTSLCDLRECTFIGDMKNNGTLRFRGLCTLNGTVDHSDTVGTQTQFFYWNGSNPGLDGTGTINWPSDVISYAYAGNPCSIETGITFNCNNVYVYGSTWTFKGAFNSEGPTGPVTHASPFINEGTYTCDGGDVVSNSSFTNNGTLILAAGCTFACNFSNFAQGSAGTLRFTIDGIAAGDFGQLLVPDGTCSFDGTCDLDPTVNYTPANGDSFAIIECDLRSGTFSSVTGTDFGGGYTGGVSYAPDGATVEVAGP